MLGSYSSAFLKNTHQKAFIAWVNRLIGEFYHNEPPRHIVSFGFINSPEQNTTYQPWHLDYGHQVSNLFVPLNELTINNSTEFIRGPLSSKTHMPESNNFTDGPDQIMKSERKKWLEIVQVVCKPFMILKLHCGIVHRGMVILRF